MNLDNVNDVNFIKSLLAQKMVRLTVDIDIPGRKYKAGEWFFFRQDENGIELYFEDPSTVLALTWDEWQEWVERIEL